MELQTADVSIPGRLEEVPELDFLWQQLGMVNSSIVEWEIAKTLVRDIYHKATNYLNGLDRLAERDDLHAYRINSLFNILGGDMGDIFDDLVDEKWVALSYWRIRRLSELKAT